MDTPFTRYIKQGNAAIETHPDYVSGGIDKETAAVDTIASVLHAIYGRKPLADVMDDAYALLERASRSFDGDYEDLAYED